MTAFPDYLLVGISLVLVLSIFASKVAECCGVPALLLFRPWECCRVLGRFV